MEMIQVMLVGGRQTPNVIGVMRFRPSQVVLIVSKDERSKRYVLLDSLRNIESFSLPTKRRYKRSRHTIFSTIVGYRGK